MKKTDTNDDNLLSLDTYSNQIEKEIGSVLALRNRVYFITSYQQFIREKETIVQSLFDIERILRDSCMFIRKNYIRIKQALQLNNIIANKETCSLFNDEVLANELSINKSLNEDDNKGKDDQLIKSLIDINREDDDHSTNQITFKGRDKIYFIEEEKAKDKTELNESTNTKKNIEPPLQYSNTPTIDNNTNTEISNKTNTTGSNIRDSQVFKPKRLQQRNKDNNKADLYSMLCSFQKQNSSNSLTISKDTHMKILSNGYPSCKGHNKRNEQLYLSTQALKHSHSYYSRQSNTLTIGEHTNHTHNQLKTIIHQRELSLRNKNTPLKITELILKLNSNQTLSSMIFKLFGDNAIESLMQSPPNEALIEAVDKSIKEIERLEEEDKRKAEEKETSKPSLHSTIDHIRIEEGTSINNRIKKDYFAFNTQLQNNFLNKTKKRKNNLSCSIIHSNSKKVFTAKKDSTYSNDLLSYIGFNYITKTKSKCSSLNTSNLIDISSTSSNVPIETKKKSSLINHKAIPKTILARSRQLQFNNKTILS